MLSPVIERKVGVLLLNLKELNEAEMKLRLNSCTIRKVRTYFDSVMEAYSTLEARIDADARIAQGLFFESGFVKWQDWKEGICAWQKEGH